MLALIGWAVLVAFAALLSLGAFAMLAWCGQAGRPDIEAAIVIVSCAALWVVVFRTAPFALVMTGASP